MAADRIKGITIEIGGDTQKLNAALKETNGSIRDTQTQLKDVERLLKLDPDNTVLLQQKQELLAKSIEETGKKLETLKTANEQAAQSAEKYDAWKAKYAPIQQEIEQTKAKIKELETAQREIQNSGDVNSSQYNELQTEISETSTKLNSLKADAREVNDEFGNPISHEQYDALQREIIETEASLKDLKTAAGDSEGSLERVGNTSQGASSKFAGLCDTIKAGGLVQAADQLSVVGDKIQEVGDAAVDAFGQMEGATSKASAYFGETGDAAEETAAVIKDVYLAGVGDSMDGVSNAVIMVKKNIQDLDSTELTNLTKQAITLDELYGIDMNETMRGVNSLMEQFGMSGQEAMDYIVKGTQNGLDKTNELGDNLAEYSGKFAQAGYSAQDYFQLLNNGLDGGAYNLDKVNDSINEVTTRLADGTIGDVIGTYSQETQNLFTEWQNGGATQKQVIDSIVGDIQNTTSQQDALNMAATAFGTMAEDGNLKFISSLSSVGDAYANVSGSAQNMFDQTTTPMQEMEANTRKLKESLAPLGEILLNLANQIIPPLVSGVQGLSNFFSSLPGPVQNFIAIFGGLIAIFTAIIPIITAVGAIIFMFGSSFLAPVIAIIAGVAAAVTAIIAVFQNWGSIVDWFKGLWQGMQTAFETAWNAIVLFFTDTIPAAFQSLVEFFQGIPEWWSGIWQQVSDFFGQIWTGMLENPVIFSIVETITNLWNNCTENLSMIWETIQTVAAAAWEIIKNIILGPVLLLCDLVLGNFDKLKSDALNIWNNIQTAASTIWAAIKTLVVNLAGNLKTGAITAITSLKTGLAELWDAIKQTASQLWEGIKETVTGIVTGIKDKGIEGFEKLKDGIAETVKKIPKVVEDGFQGAIDFITGLPAKALQWGKDFINGLIDGIESMIDDVTDAVSDVADTISDWLHFSRPEKGPLHYYESWMPDFMEGMGKGISNNMWRVLDQMEILNKGMSSTMQMESTQTKQPLTIQNHNVFTVDGKVFVEMVNEGLGLEL